MLKRAATVLAVVATASVLAACGGGPTTKADVCDHFDKLGTQLVKGNGIIGNPLFHATSDLGSTASRYPDDDGVEADGKQLKKLGDASSLSGADLENASQHIAALCGKPLAAAAMGF